MAHPSHLLGNELITIDASGPSRVGNLRSLFESALPSNSTSTVVSRQNTGIASQHTGTRAKPRISNQVRMLQAQITGDRFNGIAGAFHVADIRSSVVYQKPQTATKHRRDHIDQSQDDSIYATATQNLLGEALKMDAQVIPPAANHGSIQTSFSGSFPSERSITAEPTSIDSDATVTRATSPKTVLTSSRIRTITAQHDRDDSSATIKPSHCNLNVSSVSETISRSGTIHPQDAVSDTVRRRSTRLVSGGTRGRLSSVFTASPSSSERGGIAKNGNAAASPASSIASRSASDAELEAERSREPSMLIADDDDLSFSQSSLHLRANDGSCFDLDSRSTHTSPTKTATVRRAKPNAVTTAKAQIISNTDASSSSKSEEDASVNPSSASSPSMALEPKPSIKVADPGAENDTAQLVRPESSLHQTETSTLLTPRPVSARLPHGIGKPARALYDFEGEAAFNELSVRAGQPFDILNEQLAGGWSLGLIWDENGVPTRGLIPQGFYCLIQDFTRSPEPAQGSEPPPMPDLVETGPGVANISLAARTAASSDRSKASLISDVGSPASSPNSKPGSPGQVQVQDGPIALTETPFAPSESVPEIAKQNTLKLRSPPDDVMTCEPNLISVSAFLEISNEAAQWQQVKRQDATILPDAIEAAPSASDEPPVLANLGVAIDGMPASSTESHPFDWSAVRADQSPSLEAVSLPSEAISTVEPTTANAIPVSMAESTLTAGSDWKGSLFGKKTFNRFASFVTSGAEDYVLSDGDLHVNERSRTIARKVSEGKPIGVLVPALTEVTEEDQEGAIVKHGRESTDTGLEAQTETSEVVICATDPNQHFVIAGPAGPKWKSRSAPFLVQVHHPEKRTKLNGMHEYTIYHVTSTYPLGDQSDAVSGSQGCIPYDPLGGPHPAGAQVTVLRRFTQFEWLHQVLAKHFSALLIHPVPEKQYSGRFASDFIETRRADLEMWMSRLVRHPVLRYSEPLRFFLSCEDEVDWRSYAANLLRYGCSTGKTIQGGVFAHTWHPEFNFDASEAEIEADRMEAFLKAQEKTINGVGGHNAGKHGLLAAYKAHREGNMGTSSTYRDLSYTLLRTLTGAGAGPSDDGISTSADAHRILGPPMGNVGKRSDTGATNEHGAWCWREDCLNCLNLTSALQNTAECMQNVADIYESHARETLLRQHERFKEVSRPYTMAQALLETHRTTLTRYQEATCDAWADGDEQDKDKIGRGGDSVRPEEAEKIAARCETVLNVTLSEMDRLHDERVQDYHALGRSLLDGEIELYESILEQLKAARLHYNEEYYERETDFHVLASRYQADLGKPKKPSAPLLMPSAAQAASGGLKGGVGLLISQATGGRLEGVDRTPLASPRIGGGGHGTIRGAENRGLRESTNVLHQSSADVALKTCARQHHVDSSEQPHQRRDQSRTSSYFSAIWR